MNYILAPFSNMPSKMWGLDHFIVIAIFLQNVFKLQPIIFCSKEEYELVVRRNLFSEIDVEYVVNAEDFKIVFDKVQSALFYLGIDTGIMHVAAYFDKPIFSIFSSRDALGKWTPDSSFVRIYRNDVDCKGCLLLICPFNNKCMESTSSAVVLKDLESFLTGKVLINSV